jgi:glycosyltransferase involved in cell wall biosynthesis
MTSERVAFFTDTFHEVNGVANTSRQFADFAARRNLPFFKLHPGSAYACRQDGTLTTIEIPAGPLSFNVEADMLFDLAFLRNLARVRRELEAFSPTLIHVTSPGHCGILGVILARQLKLPLVAGWHTNIHEYAGSRLAKLTRGLPASWSTHLANAAERAVLACAVRYYRMAHLIFAPNQDLVDMLSHRTGRDVQLMRRGVDTVLFSPEKRDRPHNLFTLGYTGRLTAEKNVRLLAEIERALLAAGRNDFRIVITGQGSEREWLERNLTRAEFTGVLKGDALARAFANLDVFVFPSYTDTYGNVIQEAMAAGVPAIVTTGGGPKYLVRSGVSGFIAADEPAFIRSVIDLYDDRALLARLRNGARKQALQASWDRVFEDVYSAYGRIQNREPVPAFSALSHR